MARQLKVYESQLVMTGLGTVPQALRGLDSLFNQRHLPTQDCFIEIIPVDISSKCVTIKVSLPIACIGDGFTQLLEYFIPSKQENGHWSFAPIEQIYLDGTPRRIHLTVT